MNTPPPPNPPSRESPVPPPGSEDAALAAAALPGGVLDPVRLLQPGATSPYGAPGMPARVKVLDVPGEMDGPMFVQFGDGRAEVVGAFAVERVGPITSLLRRAGKPVALDDVRRVVNLMTLAEVEFAPMRLPEVIAPAAAALIELLGESLELVASDPVDLASVAALLLRLGKLLLDATGHVKSPAYIAWERDVEALGKPSLETRS